MSAGSDSKWNFYDFETAKAIAEVTDSENQSGYTCISFHPDGNLLGAGTNDSVVQIWDVKSQRIAANFGEHTGKINALAFSENGQVFFMLFPFFCINVLSIDTLLLLPQRIIWSSYGIFVN